LLDQIQKNIASNIQECLAEPYETIGDPFTELSKREQQVMELLMLGKLNKQIANELCIANSTVEFHRSRVMKKYGAKNLAHLIVMYLQRNKSRIPLN